MDKGKEDLESGFGIHNILLLESSFLRIPKVVFGKQEIEQQVDIANDVSINIDKNLVSVTQTLHYAQIYNEEKQITATIKMAGVFEKIGDSPIELEKFGKINGAAIIYPYIREHLSNLSAKAGVGTILLPPANFTKSV
jgi:preprotein translocase subunit SecB